MCYGLVEGEVVQVEGGQELWVLQAQPGWCQPCSSLLPAPFPHPQVLASGWASAALGSQLWATWVQLVQLLPDAAAYQGLGVRQELCQLF